MKSVANTPDASETPGHPLTSLRPFHRRMVVNTLATGAGNVWAMAVALISVPLLLSGLGIRAFGVYALLLTFSAVSGWFSLLDLGVWTATTREIAAHSSVGDHEEATTVVRTAFVAVAGTAAVTLLGFGSFGPVVLPRLFHTPTGLVADFQAAIVIFSATIFFDLMTETAQAGLEGYQRVDLSRACDAIRRFLFAAATASTAVLGGGLRGVAWAGLGAAIVGAAVTALVLVPQLGVRGVSRDPLVDRVCALLRAGRVVAVLRPLGVVERTMNRTIVGVVLGPAAVTLVELASQVQNGADAVLSASSYAVVPGSSWLSARGDHSRLRDLVVRGTKYAVLVTVGISVLGALLAEPLMRVWIGAAGAPAVDLARLGLLSVAMVAPIAVGSNLLLGTGHARSILVAASAAIVVNLGVSLALVQAYGAVGAFIGTLTANVVVVPTIVRAFLRVTGVRTSDFLRRAIVPSVLPVAAMAAATGLVLAGSLSDWLTLILGTVAGIAALLGIGSVTFLSADERTDLISAFRRSAAAPVTGESGAPRWEATSTP